MILAVVFYRYTAVRPALLPDGKRGYRAAIQGLHALSLASLDAICGIGCLWQPFQEQLNIRCLVCAVQLDYFSDFRAQGAGRIIERERSRSSPLPANFSASFLIKPQHYSSCSAAHSSPFMKPVGYRCVPVRPPKPSVGWKP